MIIEEVLGNEEYQVIHFTNRKGYKGPKLRRDNFNFSKDFKSVYRSDREKTEIISDLRIGRIVPYMSYN